MEQVEIEIDLPTYKRWEKAADAAGMTMEDWFRHAVAEAVDAINTVAAMPAYEKKQA